MQWYKKVVFQNYANFQGRARRKEYWMFILFNMLIAFVLYIPAIVFMAIQDLQIIGFIFLGLYCLYGFAVFVPCIAVIVRRLHDQGKSGWWYFIGLIPFIGPIWMIVLMCLDGERTDNQYGPSPKHGMSID